MKRADDTEEDFLTTRYMHGLDETRLGVYVHTVETPSGPRALEFGFATLMLFMNRHKLT